MIGGVGNASYGNLGITFYKMTILYFPSLLLTLLLLNTTCPVLANSVDTDQLASEEAN